MRWRPRTFRRRALPRVQGSGDRYRPTVESLEARMLLSVFTVDRLTDSGQGQGTAGDLRYCLTQAADGDQVTFAVTGTIPLSQALPELRHNVSIGGPGANLLTVDGQGRLNRIFRVDGGAHVAISGLTMANGVDLDRGAGVWNLGDLTLRACTIRNNVVIDDVLNVFGGGIYNDGTLSLVNCTVSGNGAEEDLGSAYGGGVYNAGTLFLLNSTVSGNSASGESYGGQPYGGGIYNAGNLAAENSTITANTSARGSGIGTTGALTMRNTIVAGNDGAPDGPDLYGNLTSSGHNLIGSSSGGSGFTDTDLLDVDPRLGPLQDNGGPTQTHALLPGSPAIDAGDNTDAPPCDQRGPGYPRIVNGTIDIGAFEVQDQGPTAAAAAPAAQGTAGLSAQPPASQAPCFLPRALDSTAQPAPWSALVSAQGDSMARSTTLTAADGTDYFWLAETREGHAASWDWAGSGSLV